MIRILIADDQALVRGGFRIRAKLPLVADEAKVEAAA